MTSAFNFKVWSPTTLKVLTNAFNFKIRSQTKVKVLTDATDLILETRRQPTQHFKFQKPVGEHVCFANGAILTFRTNFHIVLRAPVGWSVLFGIHFGIS